MGRRRAGRTPPCARKIYELYHIADTYDRSRTLSSTLTPRLAPQDALAGLFDSRRASREKTSERGLEPSHGWVSCLSSQAASQPRRAAPAKCRACVPRPRRRAKAEIRATREAWRRMEGHIGLWEHFLNRSLHIGRASESIRLAPMGPFPKAEPAARGSCSSRWRS